jgi:ABC-type glycerol-3-phosphate transport system substrate-binding protein
MKRLFLGAFLVAMTTLAACSNNRTNETETGTSTTDTPYMDPMMADTSTMLDTVVVDTTMPNRLP